MDPNDEKLVTEATIDVLTSLKKYKGTFKDKESVVALGFAVKVFNSALATVIVRLYHDLDECVPLETIVDDVVEGLREDVVATHTAVNLVEERHETDRHSKA